IVSDGWGRRFYNRILVRPPSDPEVEFVLIPNRGTTPAFYIMSSKVTVGQFRAYAMAEPSKLIESKWQKGAKADGKDTDSRDDNHPVFRVTFREASDYARWLGGELQTARQWDLAAGRFETNAPEGPYTGGKNDLAPGQVAFKRKQEGPAPAGASP